MYFDLGAGARGLPSRLRILRGMNLKVFPKLIWMAVLASLAMTWAAGDGPAARDPERQQVLSKVSERPSVPDVQAGTAAGNGVPETNADRCFRACMLPGAALLVIIISITLVAIFFPRRKTD